MEPEPHASGVGLDLFHARYGRFLAGDVGLMLDINRQYDTGAVLGAYWSFTDTDIFQDPFNRGYSNKGVYLKLPVRMFIKDDSPRRYEYGISPWTRDVAATIPHWQGLYELVHDLTPVDFKKNKTLKQ